MRIHKTAAVGFGSAAGEYARSRPDYAPEAVGHLATTLGIAAGSRVLDLACGTGKLTRPLAEATGATIVGIDPVGSMLDQFRASASQVPLASGTAEAIPFAPASFDAVTVAQAFHWFDGAAALAEIHRVLKASGGLGLIWNARDESVPWVAKMGEIFNSLRTQEAVEVIRFWKGTWRKAFQNTTLFTPLDRTDFAYEQMLTRDGVVERVLSVSFVAMLPEDERAAVAERMRAIIDEDPETAGKEQIALPHRVQVYTCRRI